MIGDATLGVHAVGRHLPTDLFVENREPLRQPSGAVTGFRNSPPITSAAASPTRCVFAKAPVDKMLFDEQ